MHLLLIHQAFASDREPGGTRHFELLRELGRRGHPSTVIASTLSYLTGRATPAADTTDEGGPVRVIRAYTYPALHRSFVWRLVCFLVFMCSSVIEACRVTRVSLVMATSPPMFQALSAWLVARLRRRPLLLEIRDLWPAFPIDLGLLRNPGLIALCRGLERFLYAQADHILVNSPAYRDYLLARGVAPAKITLIANGVDLELYDGRADGAGVRAELGLDGKFVVTYAGALGISNDIDTILGAADLLRHEPDVQFLLVGDGKERPRLQAECRALALPNVRFLEPRPKAAMPALLAASDACVATLKDIPMFRTTYPNKVFDYMAAARPTILGIDGVIREVIERAEGGVCVGPGDAKALAEAVRYFLYQPSMAREMGACARAYVEAHFDRRRQAEEFVRLVERLAAGR